ncbi:MAG: hypothetical protein ACE5IH_00005, partial [Thermodesulfobacteriota bacterium]
MNVKTPILDIIREFNKKGYRYVLIGRQAVIQYGAPLMSIDYDFWIHPEDKEAILSFLADEEGFEGPSPDTKKPIAIVYLEEEKIDLFFYRRIINRDGTRLSFDDCFDRAVVKEDPEGDFFIRIPCIDDLIALKRIRKASPKDEE